ncbi:MAG: DUF4249 domain-containing protein [Bacteroidaceae bacterium]|nr:DUF4249 domain-containing protein [Bacteroidaceae bacterium]
MKTKRTILFALCLLAFCACEKEVEFDGPAEEVAENIIINAVAVEGDSLRVFVTLAHAIDNQTVKYIDYQHAMFMDGDFVRDFRDDTYYMSTRVYNAEVTAVVNDGQTYQLTQDAKSFVCGYKPMANDHIVLHVKVSDGSLQITTEATAETTVPAKPQIEVLKHEVLKDSSYYEVNQLKSYADSIMRITCRIVDAGGNQYYRLRIRGERVLHTETWYNPIYGRANEYKDYIQLQDVFFSTDPLFVDARLNNNFGGWPAYFSNVFDNSLMQGKDYTFTLDSPKPNLHFTPYRARDQRSGEIIYESKIIGAEFEPRVMVELQAITPDFYRYLKSAELYRVTQNDAFSEPLQIYSNVTQGWGIFGSMSSQRIFISYD